MESSINLILNKVKSNKKYKSLADEIVLEEIKKYLEKNPDENINKLMVKEIRSKLHRLYSTYSVKKNRRNKLLEKLKKNPKNKEIIKEILKTSVSANERLENYANIYKNIFKITGKPSSLVDLGCGLNPLSFSYMNLNKLDYYAFDIDEQDIQFLNDYFKIMNQRGLNGKAQILDARNKNAVLKLPPADIVFMFKLIDLMDIENHKPSEELIKILINKTRFIVASFATKTISKKSMNFPERKWFEIMLKRIGLNFKNLSTNNEIFYIIKNL